MNRNGESGKRIAVPVGILLAAALAPMLFRNVSWHPYLPDEVATGATIVFALLATVGIVAAIACGIMWIIRRGVAAGIRDAQSPPVHHPPPSSRGFDVVTRR